jgi:hypothetical protein
MVSLLTRHFHANAMIWPIFAKTRLAPIVRSQEQRFSENRVGRDLLQILVQNRIFNNQVE